MQTDRAASLSSHGKRLRELTVSGTPYEMGLQHGSTYSCEIRSFLNDHLARVNILRNNPISRAAALQLAAQYADWIEAYLPEIAEEIAGLAAGAGILYEEAVLLQIRRELIRHKEDAGDCTSIAHQAGERGTMIAQTIDLAGGMDDLALILRVQPANQREPRVCMFTFVGLCGYAGINSSGLAVGLNMIFSSGWRASVPVYLLVRSLLQTHSVEEACQKLREIPRTSSRYLVLADLESLTGIEMTVDNVRVLTEKPMTHTNHFIHQDFEPAETLCGQALAGSRRRLDRLNQLIAAGTPLETILRDHDGFPRSICAHSMGDMKMTDTVGAILMEPVAGVLRALVGHPCEKAFESYSVPQYREIAFNHGNS